MIEYTVKYINALQIPMHDVSASVLTLILSHQYNYTNRLTEGKHDMTNFAWTLEPVPRINGTIIERLMIGTKTLLASFGNRLGFQAMLLDEARKGRGCWVLKTVQSMSLHLFLGNST